MAIERTLVLVKPDALQRGLVGEVVSRLEKRGFKIIGMKMMQLDKPFLRRHYAHIADKPFFPRIEEFMSSAPLIAMAIEGNNAVEVMRTACGVTKAYEAAPGTIRGDYALSVQCNVIHASDSRETAAKEVPAFFKKEELFNWKQTFHDYLYSPDEISK